MTAVGPTRARFIHRVDVQLRDTERRDATGSLDVQASTIATGLACLVVDKGAIRRTAAYGTEVSHKMVRVLFPDPIALGLEHQLRFEQPAGTVRTLLVNSCHSDAGLDVIWVAECQETPDPVTPAD